MSSAFLINDLPDVVIEKIFSYLTYDEIARNRLVCRSFDEFGRRALTRGFFQVEKKHSAIYKRMKVLLPRRESERRVHPLSRYCDILSAVETRLSMLSMTYLRYIEGNMCCFIPGKVIDEIHRILLKVDRVKPVPRTHELLQELRDISSMAMEHFDEIILPRIKHTQTSEAPPPKSAKTLLIQVVTDELQKVKKQTKINKQQVAILVDVLKTLNSQCKRQTKMLREKTSIINEMERKLQDQSNKLLEQEASIADLKKHVDEWDQKFSDLTAELIRAREDPISKSSTPLSQIPDINHISKSNIKPRVGLSKFFEIPQIDLERKRKSTITSEIPNKIARSFVTISNDDITNKINENITSNISKNITNNLNKNNKNEEKIKSCAGRKIGFMVPLLSNPMNLLLKQSALGLKLRKRKLSDEIEMK